MADPRKLIVVTHPVLTSARSRQQIIQALTPFAYWPLDEAAGSTIADRSGNGYNGTGSAGLTYGHDGPGSGNKAIYFDGNEYINVYSAGLGAAYPTSLGPQGSLCVWAKADDWVSGQYLLNFLVNANNQTNVQKNNTNDRAEGRYYANATYEVVAEGNGQTSTAWRWYCITWDINAGADGEMKFFVNNAQIGSTQTALGVWTGNLAAAGAALGAADNVGSNGWLGYLSEAILFARALDAADRAVIYGV